MRDGRGQVRRQVGLRLWLSAGWLTLLLLAALLAPWISPKDPLARREPWPEAASAIVYAMRSRRILLSCDGMSQNVIKIVRHSPPRLLMRFSCLQSCFAALCHMTEAADGLQCSRRVPRPS
jgi:hypothetical protein